MFIFINQPPGCCRTITGGFFCPLHQREIRKQQSKPTRSCRPQPPAHMARRLSAATTSPWNGRQMLGRCKRAIARAAPAPTKNITETHGMGDRNRRRPSKLPTTSHLRIILMGHERYEVRGGKYEVFWRVWGGAVYYWGLFGGAWRAFILPQKRCPHRRIRCGQGT